MLLHQVALVSESSQIAIGDVLKTAAALQKQASRDFAPLWSINATINAFHTLEDVPVGYWPIIIRDDINTPGAAGVHEDHNGQPFALVQSQGDWQLTASHECLEMLADPFGNRLIAGNTPDMKVKHLKPGRVEYLVEVCDPCESDACTYSVNGIRVSDFLTPHFYDPVASPGTRYSFTGKITAPRQILADGYITWHNPADDNWYQIQFFSKTPKLANLGKITQQAGRSLRSIIDSMTPRYGAKTPPTAIGRATGASLLAAKAMPAASLKASTSKAQAWRQEIDALLHS